MFKQLRFGVLIFSFFIALLIFGGFFGLEKISALQLDVAAQPGNGTLSGASAGNQQLTSASLSLADFPATAQLTSASLSFYLGPTAYNDGSLTIYDKYNYGVNGSVAPLQVMFLNNVGTKSVDITSTVSVWLLHPDRNLGLVFKGVNLPDTAQVQLTGISLNLQYNLPVIDPIQLLSGPDVEKLSTNKYRITTTVNKPVTAVLAYGKTVNYGNSVPITIPSTTIVYDLDTLQSGISYHYHLVFTDNASAVLTTPDQVFIPQLEQAGNVTPSAVTNLQLDLRLFAPIQLQTLIQTGGNAPQVQLNWPASASGSISGYRLLRREAGTANFSEIARVNTNTFVYVDTDVLPGQSFEYQIRVYTATSESAGTSSGTVVIPIGSLGGIIPGGSSNQELAWGFVIVASGALVLYLVYKACQKIKIWLNPKPRKKQLRNVFRDPDLVD